MTNQPTQSQRRATAAFHERMARAFTATGQKGNAKAAKRAAKLVDSAGSIVRGLA